MIVNVLNIQCFRSLVKPLFCHLLSSPSLPFLSRLLHIRLLTVLELIIEGEWVTFDLFRIFTDWVLEFPWTVPVVDREIFTQKG